MHPNCRCSIIAVEEELYNYQTQFNPYGFIPALQNAINDPYAKLWGNVFILHSNHSQDIINSSKLQPIAPYVENPILIDYDKISSDLSTWWENYCNDAITFFNAIVAGSEERFGIAFEQIAENGILGVPYLLDAAHIGAGQIDDTLATNLRRQFSFADENKLNKHFEKHVIKQNEFGSITKDDYLKHANDFIDLKHSDVLERTASNGDLLKLNTATDEFIILTKDGVIRTYHKLDPKVHGLGTNLDYWNSPNCNY